MHRHKILKEFLSFESTDTMLSHISHATSTKSLHTTTYILRTEPGFRN